MEAHWGRADPILLLRRIDVGESAGNLASMDPGYLVVLREEGVVGVVAAAPGGMAAVQGHGEEGELSEVAGIQQEYRTMWARKEIVYASMPLDHGVVLTLQRAVECGDDPRLPVPENCMTCWTVNGSLVQNKFCDIRPHRASRLSYRLNTI